MKRNETLYFEDMEPSQSTWIHIGLCISVGILVTVLATDALVAARAERPHTILGRRAVAGEENGAYVGGLASVFKRRVELVDGMRAKGVTHFRAIEGNTHRSLVNGAVIRDIREVEFVHGAPCGGVEQL